MFTIYGLFVSGAPDAVEYVGVTGESPVMRLAGHIANRAKHYPVSEWITSVMSSGNRVELRVLQQAHNREWAGILEREWIAYYLRLGKPLHNVSWTPADPRPKRSFQS